MSLLKKAAAFAAAAAMALSATACGKDTSWGAEIDGVTLRAGIMIYFQSVAVSDAMQHMPKTDASAAADGETTTTAESVSVLDITIEDKPARVWINEKARESMQEFVAVEKKFDELGLAFENKEDERNSIIIDQMWDNYGSVYEEIGVSKQSYSDIGLNNAKRDIIFNYYYGAGGEKAVSDDAITAYLRKNNARIKYIAMPLKDGEGNLLKSEGKAELKKMAEGYIDRLNTTDVTFEQITKEYDDYYDALVKAAAPADENAGDTDTDEDIDIDLETDTAPNYGYVVSKDSSYPSKKVIDTAFGVGELPQNGSSCVIIEDDDNEVYYLVQVLDLFADPDYLENNRSSVLYSLKGDEFSDEVKSWTSGQNVVVNQDALDRYKLEKLTL